MGDSKKQADGSSDSKEGVMIQRVIREVGGGSSYPILTKTNYSEWASLMKVKLKARVLWNIIEVGGVNEHEEIMVLDALCTAVPPEMVLVLIDKKKTAKEVWDAIAKMRVGDDRVKKSIAVQLRRKFDLASFNDGETVEDYALCLQGMVATLATLGEVVDESKIVEKIIRSVLVRFK
jgi:hypothetical protein